MNCPCGSTVVYSSCCEPFLKGTGLPETAEKMMRSRYTAYVEGNVEYIRKTLAPESRNDFDEKSTRDWARSAKWKGLRILSTEKGGVTDKKGTVEFVATYEHEGAGMEHHEVSRFRKADSGQWYFIDGDAHTHREGEGHEGAFAKPQTVQREAPKIGRNDPCPCGSEKKYKKCCGAETSV